MQKRSYLWHVTEPLESQPSPLCTPRPPDEPYPTPMPRPLPMPERAWLSSPADATRAGITLSGLPRPRSSSLKQQQQQQQPVLNTAGTSAGKRRRWNYFFGETKWHPRCVCSNLRACAQRRFPFRAISQVFVNMPRCWVHVYLRSLSSPPPRRGV